jgi:hypothetical protein
MEGWGIEIFRDGSYRRSFGNERANERTMRKRERESSFYLKVSIF